MASRIWFVGFQDSSSEEKLRIVHLFGDRARVWSTPDPLTSMIISTVPVPQDSIYRSVTHIGQIRNISRRFGEIEPAMVIQYHDEDEASIAYPIFPEIEGWYRYSYQIGNTVHYKGEGLPLPEDPVWSQVMTSGGGTSIKYVEAKLPELKVAPDFTGVYESGRFSDVEVVTDSDRIKAHRVILATASAFFSDITGEFPEAPVIKIEGVDPKLSRQVLELIYGYRVNIDGIQTVKLLKLATSYFGLNGLVGDTLNAALLSIQVSGEEEISELRELIETTYPASAVPSYLEAYIRSLE